ncbi:MAG: protein translocase subunit SecF [Clostridia bacterium]|nr:protein translocase subunit SecF [Clostridia bacterium]
MNFLKHKNVFLILSILVIVSGIVIGFVRGFKFDIDFMGGTRIQVDIGESYDERELKNIVKEVIGEEPLVQSLSSSENMVSLTTNTITEEQSNSVIDALKEKYTNLGDSTIRNVQPSYGKELIESTIIASIVAIILLFVYIVIRFKVLGVAAAISAVSALLHDMLVMIAIYGFLNLPINATFVAVVLTILGYSINDTIVIFDRVREIKKKSMKTTEITDIINESLNQTLKRTLYTSITTVTAVLILFILATVNSQQVLQEFSLPLMIGVISGTYSSLFIAPTLYYYFSKIGKKSKSK